MCTPSRRVRLLVLSSAQIPEFQGCWRTGPLHQGSAFRVPAWARLPSGGDGAAGRSDLRRQPLHKVALEAGVCRGGDELLSDNNESYEF